MTRSFITKLYFHFVIIGAVTIVLPDFLGWFQQFITTKEFLDENSYRVHITPLIGWDNWLLYRYRAEKNVVNGYYLLAFSLLGMLRMLGGSQQRPKLGSLNYFADLWGLQLRKKIKALAGDYDAEIARLHKQRRYKTAHWNRILAWGYAIWYVLRGPLDWVTDYLISAVKGR